MSVQAFGCLYSSFDVVKWVVRKTEYREFFCITSKFNFQLSYFEIDDGELVDVFNDMLYRLTICYNLQNSQG